MALLVDLCKYFPFMLKFVNQKELFDYICKIDSKTDIKLRLKPIFIGKYFTDTLELWVKYINNKQGFINLLKTLNLEFWYDDCDLKLLAFIFDNFTEIIDDVHSQDVFLDEILDREDLTAEVWEKILNLYFTYYINKQTYYANQVQIKINKQCPKELRNKLDMMNVLLNIGES